LAKHLYHKIDVGDGYQKPIDMCRATGYNYIEIWIPVNDAIFSDEIKELEALIHRVENTLFENIGIPVVIRLKEKNAI